MNPWEVLGIQPGASAEEIKSAFIKRLKEVHPDHHPDDPQANEKTKQVLAAYAMLTKQDKAQVDTIVRQSGFSTMTVTVWRNGQRVTPTKEDMAWVESNLRQFRQMFGEDQ